jgi:regulator of sigma E protease
MGTLRSSTLQIIGMQAINMMSNFVIPLFQSAPMAVGEMLLAASSMSTSEWLAGWGGTLWNIVRVFLGLGFVIFVHELGHFLAAKFFGVKCEKFYVGFDVPIRIGPIRLPSKLFHFQWGETEYGIGSIPLGGYVKMLGQDDDPRRMEEENERIRLAGGQAEAVGHAQYDPRSFPAKSVFARMVIISAGVIMNIIFGIIFAAVAFKIGVPYDSSVIGDVFPGDPAWQAGLQSADRIIQVDEMKEPNPKMSFRDLREAIALAGFDNPTKPIPIIVERDGKTLSFDVVGTTRHDRDKRQRLLSLGFSGLSTTQLSAGEVFVREIDANWPEAKDVLPDFKPGDKIIAVNGSPLPIHDGFSSPLEHQLNEQLHPNFDKTIKVTVERTYDEDKKQFQESGEKAKQVELDWKPMPMKTLGIAFEPGPIAAIQVGSLAEKAGVKVGDLIEMLDDEPIKNAHILPLLIAKKKGREVTLKLRRAEKEGESGAAYTFSWRVPERFSIVDSSGLFNAVGLELPGSGIAFSPSNVIASLDPQATSRDGVSILPGEVVLNFRLDPSNDGIVLKSLESLFSTELKTLLQGRELKNGYSSLYLNSLIQRMPVGTKIKLDFMRDGVVKPASLVVAFDREWSWFDRGAIFQPARQIRTAESTQEAFSLGMKETKEKASSVLKFLRMLFTGKIPVEAAGGPGMIFYAATSAASEGTTNLLLFLTMLSANLAVINFLPIPALDGGHMMFLLYEGIIGKPVNEALQMRLTIMGVLALLSLMVFVTFNDVMNFSKLFGW